MPRMPQLRVRALLFLSAVLIAFGLAVPGLWRAGAQATLSTPAVLPGDATIGAAAGRQEQPQVSKGTDTSLVVWTDARTVLGGGSVDIDNPTTGLGLGSLQDIYAARLNSSGQVLGTTPIVVSQAEFGQIYPRVGWNGQNWLVTWFTKRPRDQFSHTYDIVAARVSPTGQVLDPTPIVIRADLQSGMWPETVIADAAGNWVVVWTDFLPQEGSNIPRGVFVSRVANDGSVLDPGGLVIYNHHSQFMSNADLARAGDLYMLVFEGYVGTTNRPWVLPLDANFGQLRPGPEALPGGGRPRIASNGDSFFAVMNGGIGARVSRDGDPLDATGITLSAAGGAAAQAAWDGANWFVSHSVSNPNGEDVAVTRVSPAGQVLGSTNLDTANGTQTYTGVAPVAGGGAQVVWHDAATFEINGSRVSAAGAASAEVTVSRAAPRQTRPRLAPNGNGFLAVFRSETDGLSRVLGQHLDINGVAVDQTPFVISDAAGSSNPSVAWDGSQYLAVWEQPGPTGAPQTFARVVPSAGPPAAPAFLVMNGGSPDAAGLNGNFVVVNILQETSQIRTTRSVRVSGAGAVVGTPVNVERLFNFAPRVVAFGTRWLAVWERHTNHDDAPGTIAGSFISPADGTATAPFVVGDVDNDGSPHLAVSGQQALVAWTNGDIHTRRLNADGTSPDPLSGSPLVTSAQLQAAPAVAWDGSQYVVTWTDQRNAPFPRQALGDVYAARVSTTNVRLAEFAVADSALPEDTPFVTGAGGLTLFAYAKFYPEAPYASHRVTLRTARFAAPPTGPGPEAPGALVAEQVNNGPGTGTVRLTWRDLSTNETGFKVERGSNGTTFTQFSQPTAGATTLENVSATSQSPNYFRVRAYNAAGDSPYSNVASAPVAAILSPADGSIFDHPAAVPVVVSAADSDGIARVDYFASLDPLDGGPAGAPAPIGSTSTPNANGQFQINWTPATGYYHVTARAFDAQGSSTLTWQAAVFIRRGPSATVTAPANDSTVTQPANVTLTATAQANNNRTDEYITRLDFYAGETWVGQGTATTGGGPYSFTWANAPAGTHNLTAHATSNWGAIGISAPVRLTVNPRTPPPPDTNAKPSVSLTSPASSVTVAPGTTITATASASDTDGQIARVEFRADGFLVESDATAPYSADISLSGGAHSITATAVDDGGSETTSAAVGVTVERAAGTQLVSAVGDNQSTFGPSVVSRVGTPVNQEIADDFDVTGEIDRLVVYGTRGWNPPDYPTVRGAYVRFYAWNNSTPGALQEEMFLAAGDPGLVFDARTAGAFDIRLPRSFRASGKHFFSVQLLIEGTNGYWYWSSARTGAPQNSAVKTRDHFAGGGWKAVSDPTGVKNNDAVFSLFGTLTGAPRVDSLSETTLARSGYFLINGANFGASQGGGRVTVGGVSAVVARWTAAQITAYVPEGAPLGATTLQVSTGSGNDTTPVNVTARPADGRIRWRFTMAADYTLHRPGIAADGTVYVNDVAGRLYALTPSGGLKWIFQAGDGGSVGPVTVGSDGTVYVGGWTEANPSQQPSAQCPVANPVNVHGVFAVNPNGTLKWVFAGTCDTIESGPNVGPDGKVYATTDVGGIGTFALTPAGALAYSTGRFGNRGGLGFEIVFGRTAPGAPLSQYYFQTDQSALEPQGEIYGYTLAGQKVFEAVTVVKGQPAVGPTSGNVYAVTFPIGAGTRLRSYTPQGALRWQSPISPVSGMSAPDAAPDETVYVTVDGSVLHAVDPATGQSRWSYDDPHVIDAPVVSPDNRLAVLGGRLTYGQPGFFSAVNTAGQPLWKQFLPDEPGFGEYGQVVPSSRARFTADGQTAYISADVLGDGGAGGAPVFSYFYALNTSASDVPVNEPPAVTMTSPIAGSTVPRRTSITISADAADDGQISGVDFYVRAPGGADQLVSTDTAAPYTVNYTPTVIGLHSIRVRARDAGGLYAEATSNFHVPNDLPRPAWTSPANGANVASGAPVTLKARASDPDGTVAKLEFYSSQVGLVGEDTTPDAAGDYSVTFASPAAGTHELTVWAVDNDGARGGASITITVGTPPPPPTPTPTPTPDPTAPAVRITTPASGGTYAAGTNVAFAAEATAAAGRTVARVEFILEGWSQVRCTDFNAPYTCNISDFSTRLYDVVAVATDSAGVVGRSAPVRVVFEDTRPKLSITGRLRHTASQPGNEIFLPNALVRLDMDNRPYREARTDAQGNYSFADLGYGGSFTLRPAEPGYTFFPPSVNWSGIVSDETRDFVAEGPIPPGPTPGPTPGANVLAWEKFYDGPESQSDGASALFVDAQGNTYVTGTTAGPGNDREIVTMKYDAAGARLWAKVFSGAGMSDDFPADIKVDADGNVYVTGTSWRGAAYWQDFVTIKYDASGAEQWARYYNGPKGDTDMAHALGLDNAGNVYVTGYVTSAEAATGRFFWEFATVKYDAAGTELWARLHSTKKYPEGHIATGIAVDASGNAYVTGHGWFGTTGADSARDVVTVKYSPAGAVLWTSRFNSGGAVEAEDEAVGVRLDPSGNPLVFGNSVGAQTQEDFLLVKLNGSTGATLWNRTWAAPFRDYAKDMAVDSTGAAVLTGDTYDADFYAATDYPTTDVATVKFDAAGNLAWERVYRAFPGKQDGGRRLALDSTGAAYVGAYSEGFFNSDTVVIKYAAGGAEAWVYRYDNPAHTTDWLTDLQADGAGNLYLAGSADIRSAAGVETSDISTAKLAVSPSTVLNAPPDVALSLGSSAAPATAAAVSSDGATASNALTVNGCTATLNATAADRDGSVTKVDFYNGSTLVSTDTAAPYSVNWTAPTSGSYALTAMATDNRGATRTAATLALTFNCGGTPPPTPVYSLNGQVTVNGAALGGVTVTLSGSQSASATTGPDGRYSFAGIPAGSNCTVTPELGGYEFAPAAKSFGSLTTNQTADFAAAARINYALAANGATASASSAIDAGRSAAGTINGDRKGLSWGSGGGWHDATNGAYPDWLEVTFGGGAKTISEVSVFTVQDNFTAPATPTEAMTFTKYGVTAFEVRYWDEAAAAWKTVPGSLVSGNNKVWRKLTFAPLTTTKIRVVTTGGMAGYSRLAEVEAWGGQPVAPPPAPPVNHALASNGATVTASSNLDAGRAAPAAINGDRRGLHWGTDPSTGSGWHDATKDAYPDWLEVTFAGARSVSEVNVFSVQDAYAAPSEPTEQGLFTKYGVTGFQVEHWTGAAWQVVPGGLVVSNNKVWAKVAFPAVTTTKIRVVVNHGMAGHARVTEVEAWGPPSAAARTNHALASNGATASASSTLDAGRAAAAAINGDRRALHWGTDPSTGSGWHDSTKDAYPDWLEVAFGGTKSISEVSVFSVQDNLSSPSEPTEATAFTKYGVRDFDVQYWTGSAWAVVPGGMVTGNNKVWRKVTFPALSTTKVRVVVKGALAGHSRLAEVEVY